jgi:hypothetical protein
MNCTNSEAAGTGGQFRTGLKPSARSGTGGLIVDTVNKRKIVMAIKVNETNGGGVLEVQVTGKLTHDDYNRFVPKFEQMLEHHGKIRVLFEMTDFHGWEGAALWDDLKFDLKHFSDIERLAMVGDRKWEKGMSIFCRPFTTAHIRYFDRAAIAEARDWLEGKEWTHLLPPLPA